MLTENQKITFITLLGRANVLGEKTAEQLYDAGTDLAEPRDVVETHETLTDFEKSHRKASNVTEFGGFKLYEWANVQMRGPKTPRGTLYLVEFGGVSASLFR